MLPESLSRDCGRWRWAQALGLFCVFAAVSTASANEIERRWQPSAARPYVVRGAERRLLHRAERFLDNQQWDDAIEALMRLLESGESNLVAIDEHRYVRLSEYCHRLLAKLPAEALARYRRLVDATAETWYRQGIEQHDTSLLRRVADQYLHSSWGGAALLALGELELQRGHYQAARNAWTKIETSEVSADQALSSTNFELSPASVQARLALVAIREGNWQLAEELTDAVGREYPQATGRLSGREVVLADYLSALLQQARKWPRQTKHEQWPTYAGSLQRTGKLPVESQASSYELLWSNSLDNPQLSIFPIVFDGLVFFQDASSVQAKQLADGRDAFAAAGELFQSRSGEKNQSSRFFHALNASGRFVYGVTALPLGPSQRRQNSPFASHLWSLDLQRDGALAMSVTCDDANATFTGAPVIVDSRAYVAIQATEHSARIGIDCYDISIGRRLWRRWLCQANTPATGRETELVSNLLTYDAGILYVSTNLGVIAAVRAADGEVVWLRTYPRLPARVYYGGPRPCVYHQATVFALPSDSENLMSLGASNGAIRWSVPIRGAQATIVHVDDERVILANANADVIDRFIGERINMANENAKTTRAAGNLGLLPGITEANLALAGDYLVAAGKEELSVFKYDVPKETNAKVSQTSTKEKRE